MNKRSATLIAASLVGVLAVAGAAFASGITGPTTSAASEPTPQLPRAPIVRHNEDRRGASTGRGAGILRRAGRRRPAPPRRPSRATTAAITTTRVPTITVITGTRVRTITVIMGTRVRTITATTMTTRVPTITVITGTRVRTITATTMTDAARPRKKRWSKRAVRATAWTAGAAAFFSALGAFGAAASRSRPTDASAPTRQKVIIRRVVKRIVIVDAAPPAPVRVVSSGGSGSRSRSRSGSGSGPRPRAVHGRFLT